MKILIKILKLFILGYVLGISVIIGTYKSISFFTNTKTELTTVYKILPVLIIYDNAGIFVLEKNKKDKSPIGGSAGPVVFIYDKHVDRDLLNHELVHIQQFYKYLGISSYLYNCIQKYRVSFEYEAYSAEINRISDKEFVEYMHDYYDITLTDLEIKNIINHESN